MRARQASTLEELLSRYDKWLYLEPPDVEAIEVVLAAALDRELPGDPVWLFFVAPSGGVKTEVLRSLSEYPRTFSLDFLTPRALVSGLTKMDRETKELVPVAGLLTHLDGRVLVVKDFTTILSSAEETRTAIYGQLRAAYDGYFEGGFGTLPEPIRIRATFGLVSGVTPIIHRYTRMTGALGERFLMVRSEPNRVKAARKARENVGMEGEMRPQLAGSVASLFETLEDSPPPRVSEEMAEEIIRIGYYTALMRTRVWARYHQGSIIDMAVASSEVPTRVSKQLSKLAQLLAVLRGHEDVEASEMATLRRIARDTAISRRQRIIEAWSRPGWESLLNVSDITGFTQRLHHQTVRNETEIMEVLEILERDDAGNFRPTALFRELLEVVYPIPLPPVSCEERPKTGSFSQLTRGKGMGSPVSEGEGASATGALQPQADREEAIRAILEAASGEVRLYALETGLQHRGFGLEGLPDQLAALRYREKLILMGTTIRLGPAWREPAT